MYKITNHKKQQICVFKVQIDVIKIYSFGKSQIIKKFV